MAFLPMHYVLSFFLAALYIVVLIGMTYIIVRARTVSCLFNRLNKRGINGPAKQEKDP